MKKPAPRTHPPISYNELVQYERDRLSRRLAALKQAEKHIRAIEPDLLVLHEQHGIYCSPDRFTVRDRSIPYSFRACFVLQLDSGGIASDYNDRLVNAFLGLGWIFEREGYEGQYGTVILRKPKTQTRIELGSSVELRNNIKQRERT
ncbi:ACP synthase [Burkholderia gladioli]|uniref:ACP synthase n=1 Tax=Burkholderia gladioli TaxID=28095 RepID=UPI001640F50D|nr:ACP synthase [Burkholderia gladioli]